uniref:HAUS augmin like complex subunit 2 n=1 Tax=Catharus ustulatus TaxID=91951 RepID=A0A8C3TWX1_CATUS
MFPCYLNFHSLLSHGSSICNSFSKAVWEVWSAPQGHWIISSEIISNHWPACATLLLFQKLIGSTLQFYFIGKKCEILQDMNRHLEAILKEKRDLRKRLIKHGCQESLPIEATFHKCIVELLTEAVTFIEKLESHLQSVRSIPQIPHMMNNMDTTLSKTEMLMIELEELTEQILKWKELQKEVYSNYVCNTTDLDFGLSLTKNFPQQG